MLTTYVPAAIALWLAFDLFVVLLIGAVGRAGYAWISDSGPAVPVSIRRPRTKEGR